MAEWLNLGTERFGELELAKSRIPNQTCRPLSNGGAPLRNSARFRESQLIN